MGALPAEKRANAVEDDPVAAPRALALLCDEISTLRRLPLGSLGHLVTWSGRQVNLDQFPEVRRDIVREMQQVLLFSTVTLSSGWYIRAPGVSIVLRDELRDLVSDMRWH